MLLIVLFYLFVNFIIHFSHYKTFPARCLPIISLKYKIMNLFSCYCSTDFLLYFPSCLVKIYSTYLLQDKHVPNLSPAAGRQAWHPPSRLVSRGAIWCLSYNIQYKHHLSSQSQIQFWILFRQLNLINKMMADLNQIFSGWKKKCFWPLATV